MNVIEDEESGLYGVIAIHLTALWQAARGCRIWTYADRAELATDARRLAQGMSYKNAIAGLSFGGGNAVLQRPQGDFDRWSLFKAFGKAVQALNGLYVTAEDVGTTVADMHIIAKHSRFVA